jgi:hypothetical protein
LAVVSARTLVGEEVIEITAAEAARTNATESKMKVFIVGAPSEFALNNTSDVFRPDFLQSQNLFRSGTTHETQGPGIRFRPRQFAVWQDAVVACAQLGIECLAVLATVIATLSQDTAGLWWAGPCSDVSTPRRRCCREQHLAKIVVHVALLGSNPCPIAAAIMLRGGAAQR